MLRVTTTENEMTELKTKLENETDAETFKNKL